MVAPAPRGEPIAALRGDGLVTVQLPPAILLRRETLKQVRSGLTTAFAVRANGGPIRGALAVEIRYELWDETFLVTVHGPQQQRTRITLDSQEKLVEWWNRTPQPLARQARPVSLPMEIQIAVDMVPFSAREEEDARRWLAEAAAGASNAHAGSPGASSGNAPGNLLDVIIATSVRRKTLHTWHWSVPLHREGTP